MSLSEQPLGLVDVEMLDHFEAVTLIDRPCSRRKIFDLTMVKPNAVATERASRIVDRFRVAIDSGDDCSMPMEGIRHDTRATANVENALTLRRAAELFD